jgi:hypothetical protein
MKRWLESALTREIEISRLAVYQSALYRCTLAVPLLVGPSDKEVEFSG